MAFWYVLHLIGSVGWWIGYIAVCILCGGLRLCAIGSWVSGLICCFVNWFGWFGSFVCV